MSNATLTIQKDEENKRLDTLLAKRFEKHSRSYIQYLFEEDCVLVNQKKAKKRALCKEGDLVEVLFKQLPDIKLDPEDIPLDILYEDGDIIICNKPAGMVTHPAPGSYTNTFAGALLFYLKSLPEADDPLRPGIIHRLDKETSGIIIAAKTSRALTAFQEMFAERKIEKTYHAICHGTLKDCSVNAPIGRHPRNRQMMTVITTGKDALTNFTLLEKKNGWSLVEAKPFTGRTHQIRVHAKYQKAPIAGDGVYGPKNRAFNRQLLHAQKIVFTHPFTEKEISITAPYPTDFAEFWDKVER
ncbi:RluA family pseudouridine synthase [bacterium]|nr:RluA family pseudouridine synthase [bacterium]